MNGIDHALIADAEPPERAVGELGDATWARVMAQCEDWASEQRGDSGRQATQLALRRRREVNAVRSGHPGASSGP